MKVTELSQRTDLSPRHFAVFVFADFGHVHPVLGTARELLARGNRVTFVVDRRFAPLIEEAGARAVTYDSDRGDFYRAADPSPDQLALDGIELLMETLDKIFPLAMAAFEDDPPDVVMYDFEHAVVARVAGHLLGAETVQFCPSHAANESFSLRAQMWSADDPIMLKGAQAVVDFVREKGIGPESLGRFGIEWDERNLVYLPRAFQIAGETFGEHYAFVGPTVAEYKGPPWTPPSDARRIALVSLGTESHTGTGFFRACAEAFDAGDWHVVMTIGRGGDRERFQPIPPHVEIHEWLPHPAVLPHADVLVCHGGMGSVMEALYYATPVVALPQAHELDLSADRLQELGVGRKIPPGELTADLLAGTVRDLLQDSRTLESLARMRVDVREAGGSSRGADLLERWSDEKAFSL